MNESLAMLKHGRVGLRSGSCLAALALALAIAPQALAETQPAPIGVVEEAGTAVQQAEPSDAPLIDSAADAVIETDEGLAQSPPIAAELERMLGVDSGADESALADFYMSRDFAPAWVSEDGLNDRGTALMLAIGDAAADGLHPDEYVHDPVLARMNESTLR